MNFSANTDASGSFNQSVNQKQTQPGIVSLIQCDNQQKQNVTYMYDGPTT